MPYYEKGKEMATITVTVTDKAKTDLEFLAQQSHMSLEEYLAMLVDLTINKPVTPPMTDDEFMEWLDEQDKA